jgi:aspartate 1-decarboxylase
MQIQVLKIKIHRVKVTGADLNYIGSITIDESLLEASNIIEGEKVSIVNINNGERLKPTPSKEKKTRHHYTLTDLQLERYKI